MILFWKAQGFRSLIIRIASSLISAYSTRLLQSIQLQPLQYRKELIQSQYSFKHFDFLQLHRMIAPAVADNGEDNED